MKGINFDYIMIIRKNASNGMLETDFLPLVFKDREKIDKVEDFWRQNPYATGLIVYAFACNNGLGYLFESYNYCMDVDG